MQHGDTRVSKPQAVMIWIVLVVVIWSSLFYLIHIGKDIAERLIK